jgi:hypothetical protein
MKFVASTERDIGQLSRWIQNDPYHKNYIDPIWWLTGNGLLSYCLYDSKGPTMYVRLDKDGDSLRLHCQFAPASEVSKMRVAKSLLQALPRMRKVATDNGLNAFVYKSVSPDLVSFMQTVFGFVPVGNDDYKLQFEGV